MGGTLWAGKTPALLECHYDKLSATRSCERPSQPLMALYVCESFFARWPIEEGNSAKPDRAELRGGRKTVIGPIHPTTNEYWTPGICFSVDAAAAAQGSIVLRAQLRQDS